MIHLTVRFRCDDCGKVDEKRDTVVAADFDVKAIDYFPDGWASIDDGEVILCRGCYEAAGRGALAGEDG